jgi:uracil-DNA glycosylase family 4
MEDLDEIQKEIVLCRKCPRLVNFREEVARVKRRAYLGWDYWGKPVPSFGDPAARLLVIGLAPGAHGANRTGRIFTGDSSGDLLYSTLHATGFSNRPSSVSTDDGLVLQDAYITAAVHCVPPQNRPNAEERRNCLQYLVGELRILQNARVVVALGKIAWDTYLNARQELEDKRIRPRPRFSHGEVVRFEGPPILFGSYHPSRQNTQTGRLTREMFEEIFVQARKLIAGD